MLSVDQLEDKLIDLAFAEDIGDGDHTTLCCIPEDAMGKSHLLIKEDGVLAGVEMAKKVFARFDPTMKVEVLIQDGTPVKKGDIAMIVTGKTRSLLQTERLMLNIMQRMSGIATMTAKYVKRLEGTKTHILDTRKTTPGLRMLEKQAVKIGGGMNHRIGLFDMILLKDNHIDFAGGIDNAIDRCHAYLKEKGLNLKIGVEVEEKPDSIIITGGCNPPEGEIVIDSHNDHRIVMAMAIAAVSLGVELTILGAEAVNKSYPSFFIELAKLGGVTNDDFRAVSFRGNRCGD